MTVSLFQWLIFILVAYIQITDSSHVVIRKTDVGNGNGFLTSTDHFHLVAPSSCSDYDAKCSPGSADCSVCQCPENNTFLSYNDECDDYDDIYDATGCKYRY